MKGRMDRRKRLRRLAAALSLALAGFGFLPTGAAHPTGHTESAGVTINGTSNMNITSTAANNVIKWEAFSIAVGEKVTFDAHNYLNYVTGNARSDIYGTLTGGGNIYLINPNGILIGDGAAINVGSLYLSTRNLSDDVLNAFSENGTNPLTAGNITGDVINLGTLNANSVTVEGNNITFKNVADVTKDGTLSGSAITGGTQNNNVTMNASGEIHIGSASGEASAYHYTINSGTKYDYKLVHNATELQNMKDNLAGNYMLAGYIDMSGTGNFTPIGNGMDSDSGAINGFHGRFDGLNYEIRNLSVDSNGSPAGLFGFVGSMVRNDSHGPVPPEPGTEFTLQNGIVENVNLVNATVKGTGGSNGVGGIAGWLLSGSVVRNVSFAGSVTGGADVGATGGIVGISSGTIERASNTGTVQGNSSTGGIVGSANGESSRVYQVYNAGAVSGQDEVGGIVGSLLNSGKVENAYNAGSVQGTGSWVGGIVGNMFGGVSNVYNKGTVTGTQYVGGIIGSYQDGTLADGYSKSGVATSTTGATSVSDTVGGNHSGGAAVDETALEQAASAAGFENGKWTISGGEQSIPGMSDDGSSSGNNSGNTTPSALGGSSGARSGGAAASVMVPSVPAPTTSADTATAPAVAPTTPAPAALPGNATAIGNPSSAIADGHPSQANEEAVPAFLAAIAEAEAVAATATAGTEREMARMAEAGALGNAPSFTMAAGGLLALSNEVNSAPGDAMSVESFGHALSAAQHGNAETSAAAPGALTEASDRSGRMSEAIAATDLAIGTEIAETDRESDSGQANASDSDTADNGKGEQAS